MRHALTIDLEEFCQIHALTPSICRDDWDKFPSEVEHNTDIILEMLSGKGIAATFFCLGWVAQRHKDLVQRIHTQGHEIACHGHVHQVIFQQSPQEFKDDVSTAKMILEDIIGEKVIGYRAPTYSITTKTMWAFEILSELGFEYDSSIFPIVHDTYGIPDAPRVPYKHDEYGLVEFPLSTIKFGPLNLPFAGGGYFRLLPYPMVKLGLTLLEYERTPFIFYIHPWEFNPHNPRVDTIPWFSRFRTYTGLSRTRSKFSRLIDDFRFTTASQVLKDHGLL